MSAQSPLPELSDDLTLLEKMTYRSRQLKSIAGLIEMAQTEGSDLDWVPDSAIRFMRAAATSIEKWMGEIDTESSP